MRTRSQEARSGHILRSLYRDTDLTGGRCTPAERSRSNNRSFVCTYWELAVYSPGTEVPATHHVRLRHLFWLIN